MARDFSAQKIKPVAAAIQLLEKQLTSADPQIRKSGVDSVPKLKAPTYQIIECAERLLSHENWFARRAAADALSFSVLHDAGTSATQLAGKYLDNEDPEIRRACARSLVDIAAQPKVELKGALLPNQIIPERTPEEIAAADALSVEAAKEVSAKLSHQDADVRQNAVEALAKLGRFATPHAIEMTELIAAPEVFVRHAVIRAVDCLGDHVSHASAAMARWFEHEDESVRYCAKQCLLTLAKYNGKQASKGAIAYIRSQSGSARFAVMQTLLELKGYAAEHWEHIVPILEDPNVSLRAMVSRVLVAAGREEPKIVAKSAKAINKRFDHEDEDISRSAIDCMGDLGYVIDKFARFQGRLFVDDITGVAPERALLMKKRAIQALGRCGDNAKPYLEDVVAEIESSDWRLRRAVVFCMEDLKEAGAGEGAKEVSRRLLHAEPDVRRAAAEALGRMGVHCGEYSARIEAALDTEEDEDVQNTLIVAYARLSKCGAITEIPTDSMGPSHSATTQTPGGRRKSISSSPGGSSPYSGGRRKSFCGM